MNLELLVLSFFHTPILPNQTLNISNELHVALSLMQL
jgi:hypothetical protein